MLLSVCEVKPKTSPCGEFPLLLWIQRFSLCWGHFSSCGPLFVASCPHMPGSSFRPSPLPVYDLSSDLFILCFSNMYFLDLGCI